MKLKITHLALLMTLSETVNANSEFMVAQVDPDMFLDMSIEELLSREITSVSKKSQTLNEIASAVYVIEQQDIRRSGAQTLPEILRMAPGVQVGAIDGNKWSVSIRGFSGVWSNKLLVMIDGRTIYNPLFAGVYWDVQDTMLEDIERIEVIRGPGATVWGANAVNGVINIITKHAKDTQGGLVSGGYGSEINGFGGVRYGGKIGEDNYYRVYAKARKQDNTKLMSGGDSYDGRHQEQAGFKVNMGEESDDKVTVQGDFYSGENRITSSLIDTATFRTDDDFLEHEQVRGGNVLGRWQHRISDTSSTNLQFFYDYTYRDTQVVQQARDTVDLEFQHIFKPWDWNEVIWGLGYRYSGDDIDGTFDLHLTPSQRDTHLYSGFVQDEMSFFDNALKVSMGIKLQQNSYSGFEYQPSARALWKFNDRHSVWAAFSRAVRTPARFDHNGHIQTVAQIGTSPAILSFQGSDDFDSERVYTYELGYRALFAEKLHIDVALFYSDYDNLRSSRPNGAPTCQPSGAPAVGFPPSCPFGQYAEVPVNLALNGLKGEVYGGEMSFRWKMNEFFALNGSYSFMEMQLHSKTGDAYTEELDENAAPHHMASLQPSFTLFDDISLDFWFRYTDQLKSRDVRRPDADISAYVTMDTRLAWRPVKNLELSLVGQNLLEESHQEYVATQVGVPNTRIERGVYGQVRWSF